MDGVQSSPLLHSIQVKLKRCLHLNLSVSLLIYNYYNYFFKHRLKKMNENEPFFIDQENIDMIIKLGNDWKVNQQRTFVNVKEISIYF